jgi:hypothetical protein
MHKIITAQSKNFDIPTYYYARYTIISDTGSQLVYTTNRQAQRTSVINPLNIWITPTTELEETAALGYSKNVCLQKSRSLKAPEDIYEPAKRKRQAAGNAH